MKRIQTYKLFLENNTDLPTTLSEWEDQVMSIIERDCQPFIKDLQENFNYSQEVKPTNDWLDRQNKMKDLRLLWRGVSGVRRAEGIIPNFTVHYNNEHLKDVHKLLKKDVRKNRTPKDTSWEVTQYLDELFEANFGFKARTNGMFTSGRREQAHSYGVPFLVFPIGNYEFVWSRAIDDLYANIEFEKYYHYLSNPDDFIMDIRKGNWMFDWYSKDMSDEDISSYMNDIVDEEMEKVIETYQDNDLGEAIKSGHEIIFKCDSYYAITYSDRIAEKYYNVKIEKG